MKCFVCEKELEKVLKEKLTPILTINIASVENPKGGGPLLFCHFECFFQQAGKVWENEIYERINKIAQGLAPE